jgi:Flp pilus assembly protein TadG
MLGRKIRQVVRSERGAAGVEMALVLPLLVALTFGAIEIGRMIWQYQATVKAVRDSVRYLTRVPVTCTAGVVDWSLAFSSTDRDIAQNLFKSGTKGSSTPTQSEFANAVFTGAVDCKKTADLGLNGGEYMPVVRLSVQVPFTEWFTAIIGVGDVTFKVFHEEVHIGE